MTDQTAPERIWTYHFADEYENSVTHYQPENQDDYDEWVFADTLATQQAVIGELVAALEWQSDVIDESITENDLGEHRLLLDGDYHKGPVVDWLHSVLTGFSKINRAALAKAKEMKP